MLSWRRRKATKDISPCNSTTHKPRSIFQPTHTTKFDRDGGDESFQFARCMYATSGAAAAAVSTNRQKSFSEFPSMSTGSLSSILPKTPSPICSDDGSLVNDHGSEASSSSSSSSVSDVFYSEVGTDLSAQSICRLSDASKLSSRLQSKPITCNAEYERTKEHMDLKSCMAASSVYESTYETDQEDPCTELCSDGAKIDYSSRDHNVSDESPADSRHKLMRRPKPYLAFLEEVNKQELDAQIDKRNKAKQIHIMNMLRRKEAAISEWEQKQIEKAMRDMRKLEKKLEEKRAEALISTQKKINSIKQAAEDKRARTKQIAEFKESRNARLEKIQGNTYSLGKLCC